MVRMYVIPMLFLFSFFLFTPDPAADPDISNCTAPAQKVSSEYRKYSLEAQVDGPLFFNTIACGLLHRYKELCAMEMVSFDTTGSVYDYYTMEAISITKAYFWLDENDPAAPILAFSTKEAAEKFRTEKESGSIVDYQALTDKIPN